MNQQTRIYLAGEVARLARVSPITVRRADGELQPMRTEGGCRIYLGERVDAWLARRQAKRDAGGGR